MAQQLTNREKLAFKLDHLSDSDIEEITEYVASMETMRRTPYQPHEFDDDLIAALSSAYENRRAQQVYEWDAVRLRSQQARAAHR